MRIFTKQEFHLYPVFRLDKLIDQQMKFDLDEFYIRWVTAIKYNMFSTTLCFDVFAEIQEYQFVVQLFKVGIVECYKTLVDCFFDFGQWAVTDNIASEKPFSPYTKLIDKCDLGTSQPWYIKQYKPILNDATRIQYWVGSGLYDEACFPGNILIWLVDLDHIIKTAASGPQPKVDEKDKLETKSYIYTVIKPYYDSFMMDAVNSLADIGHSSGYEQGKEHTIIDAKVEDYFSEDA
jgi:hypothetical protein